MWFAIIGSVLAAIASIASGVFSYKATKETNQINQGNYEDWKEYNTPAEQMNRLQNAGINPYMVNGVSNTLSQPFQVQNNLGISSLFSGLSSALSQGVGGINQSENNQIRWQNSRIRMKQAELQEKGLDIRQKLADSAIKVGDARAALLWSQGTLADLNAKFWSDMDDVRRNRYISDATIAASNADFLSEFNPLRLGYYRQFYPQALEQQAVKTALLDKQRSHLTWSELFFQERLDRMLEADWARISNNYELGLLNNKLGQLRVGRDWLLGQGRLNLQRDYYSLARKKWITGAILGLRGQNMNFLEHFIPKF